LRLADATPIPCGASRETAKRSELAGFANYGYCAAHSRWFWGVKLYVITTAEGMPVAWCLADPKIDEREVAAELFAHARDLGALRQKMIVLAEAQLENQRPHQTIADRLRPLTRLGITHLSDPNTADERTATRLRRRSRMDFAIQLRVDYVLVWTARRTGNHTLQP
jgi:hypothetical protein